MATNNAINAPLPLVVGQGGTGASSLTDHAVLVGSGTSAITPITVGATGELLVGATGADPAFATSADGDFTFTSATAGTNRILTISNTDNTNAASAGTVQLTTGGASAGDPKVTWTVTGGSSYTMGIDNSDSDSLKISNSTALGTTDSWVMTSAGERTMPLQPAFLAILTSSILNQTGDGTNYVVVWDTEVFDQNADFASTTFTAPVSGKYRLEANVRLSGLLNTHTGGYIFLQTSNRNYINVENPYAASSAGEVTWYTTMLADMDVGDTALLNIAVNNGTKVVDLASNGATDPYCWFSGNLEC